jgi:hypothetical protein
VRLTPKHSEVIFCLIPGPVLGRVISLLVRSRFESNEPEGLWTQPDPSAALRKEEHAFADTLSDRLFAQGKGEKKDQTPGWSLRRGRKRHVGVA